MLLKLIKKETVASGTMAFWWEKPAGFSFLPGQHGDFKFGELSHDFSLASAPEEENIMIATRMRDSEFKNKLAEATQIEMEGPKGTFGLVADKTKPAVLIAGGIGITPFRSIAVSETTNNTGRKIVLFYACRKQEEAAFLDEITKIQETNTNFKLIPVWTETEGHLTIERVKENVGDLGTAVYYLAGPPGMVAGTREMLIAGGVFELAVRTEEFDGY